MRPLIGVTCSAEPDGTPVVRPPYVAAVHRAGGLPVPLPFLSGDDDARQVLSRLHGIVLTGSEDLDTRAWDESLHPQADPMHANRQRTELALARVLLTVDVPLLAICGGMQVLAVAAGGKLVQHLPDLGGHVLDHSAGFDAEGHAVEAEPGSCLADVLGARFPVNTAHHQGMGSVGAGMRVTARAPDGVIEAYELEPPRYGVAVQWHPERMVQDPGQQELFRRLVDAARQQLLDGVSALRTHAPGGDAASLGAGA